MSLPCLAVFMQLIRMLSTFSFSSKDMPRYTSVRWYTGYGIRLSQRHTDTSQANLSVENFRLLATSRFRPGASVISPNSIHLREANPLKLVQLVPERAAFGRLKRLGHSARRCICFSPCHMCAALCSSKTVQHRWLDFRVRLV